MGGSVNDSVKNIVKKITVALSLVFILSAQAKEYLCYVPGGAGLSDYMSYEIRNSLEQRGVPFVAFNARAWGTVEERARFVILEFENFLKVDPEAQCHLFGFSMGGVTIRYAVNHLNFRNVSGIEEAFRSRVLSMTSFSTPHFGTPAANILNDFPEFLRPGLEQLSTTNIKRFNDPKSATYSPVVPGIPFYSYRNFVAEDEEIPEGPQRLSYAYITTFYFLSFKFEWAMNDGLVPTKSMEFGQLLDARNLYAYGLAPSQQIVEDSTPRERREKSGDFRYPHEFYSQDLGLDIDAADVFAAHYAFLNR